jgi:hypothetical protein
MQTRIEKDTVIAQIARSTEFTNNARKMVFPYLHSCPHRYVRSAFQRSPEKKTARHVFTFSSNSHPIRPKKETPPAKKNNQKATPITYIKVIYHVHDALAYAFRLVVFDFSRVEWCASGGAVLDEPRRPARWRRFLGGSSYQQSVQQWRQSRCLCADWKRQPHKSNSRQRKIEKTVVISRLNNWLKSIAFSVVHSTFF